ncbi:hypothetical protein ACFYWP_17810 [Actinacidiphila glaucinigra]
MQSSAADVDGYLSEVPEERRRAPARLRDLLRATAAGPGGSTTGE